MDRAHEKDIIRTLVKAGKEPLAKAFARSRGYRVRAINLNPKDLFGVDPGPDTRSKLKKQFDAARKGTIIKLGGVSYRVRVNYGYVEPPPGAPSKVQPSSPNAAPEPVHYMMTAVDVAREGEVEPAPGTSGYRNIEPARTLILDIPTDTVLVYPWESVKTDGRGYPLRGKPQKVKAAVVTADDQDAGDFALEVIHRGMPAPKKMPFQWIQSLSGKSDRSKLGRVSRKARLNIAQLRDFATNKAKQDQLLAQAQKNAGKGRHLISVKLVALGKKAITLANWDPWNKKWVTPLDRVPMSADKFQREAFETVKSGIPSGYFL